MSDQREIPHVFPSSPWVTSAPTHSAFLSAAVNFSCSTWKQIWVGQEIPTRLAYLVMSVLSFILLKITHLSYHSYHTNMLDCISISKKIKANINYLFNVMCSLSYCIFLFLYIQNTEQPFIQLITHSSIQFNSFFLKTLFSWFQFFSLSTAFQFYLWLYLFTLAKGHEGLLFKTLIP